jgi:uncharacterized membrane protein YeaQ/YmgE (transglycosylase-associated protein family)
MEKLVVFAVIGLLSGAAARLLYPGRQPTRVIGTMLVGAFGATVGGMISWTWWPGAEREFHTGNLIMSVLGGLIAIAIWSGVAYLRSLRGYRSTSQ